MLIKIGKLLFKILLFHNLAVVIWTIEKIRKEECEKTKTNLNSNEKM
jgi:hypothetical protein